MFRLIRQASTELGISLRTSTRTEAWAPMLSMPAHMPVLRIKPLNVDALTGFPIEYSLARNRAEAIQLSIDFNEYGVCDHDAEG